MIEPMLTKKAKIDPPVRAKLEQLGADAVKSKLIWIMNVRSLAEQDELQDLGDGIKGSTSRNAGMAK